VNEQIKQLYIEAAGKDWAYDFDPQVAEKFAELIIRKCTNMLPEDSIRDENGVHMFYVIREHFGVSEIGR
jgi:hypothetical protein